jgi:hypothetical protein
MPWTGLLRRADVAGLFLILTLTLVGTGGFLRNENVFGWDAVAFYYPWYSLLGEGLGSGDIPG